MKTLFFWLLIFYSFQKWTVFILSTKSFKVPIQTEWTSLILTPLWWHLQMEINHKSESQVALYTPTHTLLYPYWWVDLCSLHCFSLTSCLCVFLSWWITLMGFTCVFLTPVFISSASVWSVFLLFVVSCFYRWCYAVFPSLSIVFCPCNFCFPLFSFGMLKSQFFFCDKYSVFHWRDLTQGLWQK